MIPLPRTSSQVELDQVMQPLNAQGRQSIQTFIKTIDQGFRDNQSIPTTIDELAPAMQPIGPALQALRGSDRGDLPALVSNASSVLGALSRSEVDLGSLIDSANTTLAVTAARSADLGSTIDQAPATEQDTIATMSRVRTTLDTLDPTASALIPGVSDLAPAATVAQPAFARLQTLLSDAKPLLHTLQPALQQLGNAATVGVPLIAAFTPTVNRFQTDLLPFLAKVDPDTKLHNYAAIGHLMSILQKVFGVKG